MSRAFVNEDLQSEAQAELPERPQSEHPNYVTPQGLAALERRLANARWPKGPRCPMTPTKCAAKRRDSRIDRNARYLSVRIDRAILVDPGAQPRDEVAFRRQRARV